MLSVQLADNLRTPMFIKAREFLCQANLPHASNRIRAYLAPCVNRAATTRSGSPASNASVDNRNCTL
jgi:hypothetical protein